VKFGLIYKSQSAIRPLLNYATETKLDIGKTKEMMEISDIRTQKDSEEDKVTLGNNVVLRISGFSDLSIVRYSIN
jgi:hypothetical protein